MVIKRFTKHAVLRMQQRGKSREGVKMVLRYGMRRPKQDSFFMRRKDALRQTERRRGWVARLEQRRGDKKIIKAMRRRIDIIDRMRGCEVVQCENSVITTYNRTRRYKR